MESNNTVSDVVSELKNLTNDFEKNELQSSVLIEQIEENIEAKENEMNKFLEDNSGASSANTSYQELPSLNMEKDKSELIQSIEEPYNQLKEKSEFKNESEYPEFSSVQKCESIDFAYDVRKDINQSKAFIEPNVTGELNAYEKYKFREDFYSLCKNSPRYRRPAEIVYDSFDSPRNFLKESNKNFNSDFQWDMHRYSDLRYGINSVNSFRNEHKLESTPIKRDTSKSAFENDPDLLYYQSSGNRKECISPLTKKYLSQKNVHLNENHSWPKSEAKFENDFMNFYTFKIKSNNEDYKENSALNETIESEHLYSDYAKGPVFPTEVYGSRPGVEAGKEGIYTRKKKDVKIKVPEPIKDESLDENQLKQMDKKLKKLIKKNLKEDLKSHIVDLELNPSSTCWEIPPDKKNSPLKNINESTSTIAQSNVSNSVPYLPLRDVPVHELVKKLRHEFEQEGDLSYIPSDLNDVYQRFHTDYTNDKRSPKSNAYKNSSDKCTKKKLENFVKNPAKVFIESIEPDCNRNEEYEEDCNNSGQQNFEASNQNYISKKIIEQQKKQHEKRIRELEKLVKLEKLQVQTLKKILKMDPNDSMYTNTYQTYVDKTKLVSDHQEKIETKLEKSFNDVIESQIENQISDKETFDEEEVFDDDEHNQAHQESGIESSESSSERNTEKRTHDKTKISSWFFPIQSVKNTTPAPKPILKEKKTQVFEVKLENEGNEEPFDKKFGLQEAFQIYKYEFLRKSRNRVKEIKIKAARRQVAKELKLDTLEQLNEKYTKNFKNLRQKQTEANQDNQKKINYFTIDKAMFTKNRHVMSSQEIVEQTKKKYLKLPEVQQKKLKQKLEETKIRNRIKSNIFKKTIQQKVLSSGPNFNLNFKALENKI